MSLASPRDTGHVMPKSDQGFVRGMLKLKPDQPIPVAYLKLYWAARNLGDRTSQGAMPPWALVMLAIMSGADVSNAPPPTIVELWRDRQIKKGEKCSFDFRGERLEGRLETVDIQRQRATVTTPKFSRPLDVDVATVELIQKKEAKAAKV